jgi:EAL domain-containing protein (putative c-di-GMP-specific phosphodiesterase class I)
MAKDQAAVVMPDLDGTLERYRIEVSLADAIENSELSLHYQPAYDLADGRLCGMEALARWQRPGIADIEPSVFIPLAENTGLIKSLGRWALQSACRQAAIWFQEGLSVPSIAVNVSARQIHEDFTNEIAAVLNATGLPARCLELEITESLLVGDIEETARCLAQWKALGVRIALDDFGTGYCSLSYLVRLPIDRLKIDGSLIRAAPRDPKDLIVVRSIIALARELRVTVLAEGVETAEQFELLRQLGCQQAQGFLLQRPAGVNEARGLIESAQLEPRLARHLDSISGQFRQLGQ